MIASGLVGIDGLVGGTDDVDIKLPRDELFDIADAKLLADENVVET